MLGAVGQMKLKGGGRIPGNFVKSTINFIDFILVGNWAYAVSFDSVVESEFFCLQKKLFQTFFEKLCVVQNIMENVCKIYNFSEFSEKHLKKL